MHAIASARRWCRQAAFVVTLAGVTAMGARAADYALVPTRVQVAPAALCTLSVVVEAPDDSIACVECRISFDPSLVTLVDASQGALFTGQPGLFFEGVIAPDTHYVEGCLLGYRTYALTPGEVVRFVFQGDVPGVCPVRIERLNMWDIDRNVFTPDVDPYAWITIGTPSAARTPAPGGLRLDAYPNPFNPATTLDVSGARDGEAIEVFVYAADGRLVRRLAPVRAADGTARVVWDGRNDTGRRVGSGVYFAAAEGGGRRTVRKLVLLQ